MVISQDVTMLKIGIIATTTSNILPEMQLCITDYINTAQHQCMEIKRVQCLCVVRVRFQCF